MIAARLRMPSFACILCLCCCLILLLAAGPALAQTGSFPSGAVNLGSVAVNTGTPTKATLTFTFATGGTIEAPAVVTQGAPNLDFTDAGTGSCTTNGTSHEYNANETCTVVVSFAPRYAGTRYGGVNLYGIGGEPIATDYVHGIGVGPQVSFAPGQESPVASGLSEPWGVAVDGGGNVYIADTGNNRVLKETPSDGSYTVSTIGSGLAYPRGVAVDWVGNIYIADSNNSRVLKEAPSAAGYTQSVVVASGLDVPCAIAVGAAGTVYIADTYNNRVLEESPSDGGYVQSIVADSGLSYPGGVAIDGSGNVYIDDTGNFRVLKETPSGAGAFAQSTVANMAVLSWSRGVVLDGTGDVYIAVGGFGQVVKETPSGDGYMQSTILRSAGLPEGIAVDGSGEVYIADLASNSVLKSDLADPPSLNVTTTAGPYGMTSNPQTVTVFNDGNAALSFPVPSSGNNPSISANFTLDSSAANACPLVTSESENAGTLGASASCDLVIGFAPPLDTTGSYSGALVLKDNTLNAPGPGYASQTVVLGGAATAGPPFGAMAQPIDATTRSTAVAQSDNVLITGWAADPQMGAPVSQVSVLIDGTAVGNGSLGIAEPGVVTKYNNFAYYNSGWTFTYPAADLAVGSHQVTAVIADSLELTTQLRARSFSVAATASYGPPFGAMGPAIDATTRSTTVATGDNLLVTGWAADPHDGAPVSSVSISIDGATVGTAGLGIARPDVAAAQKKSAYLNSGWSFTLAAPGLSLGTHTVSATATDSLGLSATLGSRTITVAATSPDGPPFGSLDKAVDATTGQTSVSQSDNLLVEGWAADVHDGAPVSQVSILIDGTAAGNATLGTARHDVAKALGLQYTNSGWKFTMAASSLSAGTHTVTAVATDSLGLSTQLQIREITVTP